MSNNYSTLRNNILNIAMVLDIEGTSNRISLTAREAHLLMVFASKTNNKTGYCAPKKEDLLNAMKIKKRQTLDGDIKSLVAKGFLCYIKGNSGGFSNRYFLLAPQEILFQYEELQNTTSGSSVEYDERLFMTPVERLKVEYSYDKKLQNQRPDFDFLLETFVCNDSGSKGSTARTGPPDGPISGSKGSTTRTPYRGSTARTQIGPPRGRPTLDKHSNDIRKEDATQPSALKATVARSYSIEQDQNGKFKFSYHNPLTKSEFSVGMFETEEDAKKVQNWHDYLLHGMPLKGITSEKLEEGVYNVAKGYSVTTCNSGKVFRNKFGRVSAVTKNNTLLSFAFSTEQEALSALKSLDLKEVA